MPSEPNTTETGETEAEIHAARKLDQEIMTLPAVYVDSFRVVHWKDHLRLVFGERSIRTGVYWRHAVLMEVRDAKRLIKRLQLTLEKMEPPDQEGE
jgi:hypothetical protein